MLVLDDDRRQRDRNGKALAEETQGGSRRNRYPSGSVIRIVRVGSITRIALAVAGRRVSRVLGRLSRLTLVGTLARNDTGYFFTRLQRHASDRHRG